MFLRRIDMHWIWIPCVYYCIIHNLVYTQSASQIRQSNEGTEFIIAFTANGEDKPPVDKPLPLFISTFYQDAVTVQVTTPLLFNNAYLAVNETFTITQLTDRSIFLPSYARATGTGIEGKAIYVIADKDIIVQGGNQEKYSSDSYLALPISALGISYYVVCWYPATQFCEFLVAGTEDNSYLIIEFPTSGDFTSVSFNGITYYKGEVLSLTINRFQTVQIQSEGDMTGTHIQSNKPVAVLSGNVKTKVDSAYRDHLVEMLTPVHSWGKHHITYIVPLQSSNYFIKIVASENNTGISCDCGHITHNTLSTGENVVIDSGGNVYCEIISDKPILVVQMFKGPYSSSEGDPSMTLITPVEQYGVRYSLRTLLPTGSYPYNHFFIYIMDKDVARTLLIDGQDVDVSPANTVQTTRFIAGHILLSSGYHDVVHSDPSVEFGGFLYGSSYYESYAAPAGMFLNTLYIGTVTTQDTSISSIDTTPTYQTSEVTSLNVFTVSDVATTPTYQTSDETSLSVTSDETSLSVTSDETSLSVTSDETSLSVTSDETSLSVTSDETSLSVSTVSSVASTLTYQSDQYTSTSAFPGCYCNCEVNSERLAEIRRALLVNRTETWRYKMTKICITDERTSSRVMGFVMGIGVLSGVSAWIMIPDIINCFRSGSFTYK